MVERNSFFANCSAAKEAIFHFMRSSGSDYSSKALPHSPPILRSRPDTDVEITYVLSRDVSGRGVGS